MTSSPYLKLVPKPPPPRPRRLDVRISVSSARMPIGRSRAFRLIETDAERLVEIAERMEYRR
jgi:hypothetical protein